MLFYIVFILGGDAAVLLTNLLLHREGFTTKEIVIVSLLLIVGCIALDGISALFIRRCLPAKWFERGVKIHKVSKKECKFYEALGIKHWKDHIVELGMFTAFSKKEISDPNDPKYLERFILESNYGALIHLVGIPFGFLLILLFPNPLKYLWGFTFPAACINGILNLFPYMILRYNLPRLERMVVLAEKKKARAERIAAKEAEDMKDQFFKIF